MKKMKMAFAAAVMMVSSAAFAGEMTPAQAQQTMNILSRYGMRDSAPGGQWAVIGANVVCAVQNSAVGTVEYACDLINVPTRTMVSLTGPDAQKLFGIIALNAFVEIAGPGRLEAVASTLDCRFFQGTYSCKAE